VTRKLSGPMLPPRRGGTPDAAIVLLHGYGSDGHDLIALAPHWQALLPGALCVAPNAPEPCDSFAGGYQWFPLGYEGDRLASRQLGVVQACPVLLEFFADLWAQTGIAPRHTLIAGFSQGAMMALHAGLALPAEKTPMGLVGFSGALLPPEGFGGSDLARPPVCLVHGDSDDVIDPRGSLDANDVLTRAGFEVTCHISPDTPHAIAPDGLAFASDFIARLGKNMPQTPASQP